MSKKITFTASSIAWTEGGVMHLSIKADAGSEISIKWGDRRSNTHFFSDRAEMKFSHNYFPKQNQPPVHGIEFPVEIWGKNAECRIIGFSLGGDMNANDLD